MSSVRTSEKKTLASLSVGLLKEQAGYTCVAYLSDIVLGQVGKVLGERWKALNDKQRAPYEAKAAADKKRY